MSKKCDCECVNENNGNGWCFEYPDLSGKLFGDENELTNPRICRSSGTAGVCDTIFFHHSVRAWKCENNEPVTQDGFPQSDLLGQVLIFPRSGPDKYPEARPNVPVAYLTGIPVDYESTYGIAIMTVSIVITGIDTSEGTNNYKQCYDIYCNIAATGEIPQWRDHLPDRTCNSVNGAENQRGGVLCVTVGGGPGAIADLDPKEDPNTYVVVSKALETLSSYPPQSSSADLGGYTDINPGTALASQIGFSTPPNPWGPPIG